MLLMVFMCSDISSVIGSIKTSKYCFVFMGQMSVESFIRTKILLSGGNS